MNIESVVNDVKTRVEDVSNRAQGVAELSVDTVKKANKIVVPTVQNIVEKQTDAARELRERQVQRLARPQRRPEGCGLEPHRVPAAGP